VHFTHKRQAHNASVGVHRFIDRPDGLSKLRARLRPLPRFRFNFPPAKAVYDLWHIFPWATMLTRHDAARRGASRRGIPDDDEINGAPAAWIWNSWRYASGKVLGRLSRREIKILAIVARCNCSRAIGARIDLPIIQWRRLFVAVSFPIAFLNHTRNNCSLIAAGLAIKMRLTFASGSKFYARRRAAPP